MGLDDFKVEKPSKREVYSYTDEELLDFLREFREQYPQGSSNKFEKLDDFPSSKTVSSHFGGWSNALKKIDEDTYDVTDSNFDGDKIKVLADVIQECDEIESINTAFINEHSELPTAAAYLYEYGSINNCILLAGMEIGRRGNADCFE